MDRPKTAKRIDGPVSRYLNRYFSLKLTRLLARYPVTPNQVSVLSTAIGLLGAGCFFAVGLVADWPREWIWMLTASGGLILQLSSILDGVDGEIARLKHQRTRYGAYFDYMLDRYVDGLSVIGMVYASYALSDSFALILPGLFAIIGVSLSSIHAAKFLAEAKRDYLAEDDGPLRYLPCSRDVRIFAICVCCIVNMLDLAIFLLAVVPNLVMILRLYTVKKAMTE